MDMYRSGHKLAREIARNFLKSWLFAPLKKPVNTGFS